MRCNGFNHLNMQITTCKGNKNGPDPVLPTWYLIAQCQLDFFNVDTEITRTVACTVSLFQLHWGKFGLWVPSLIFPTKMIINIVIIWTVILIHHKTIFCAFFYCPPCKEFTTACLKYSQDHKFSVAKCVKQRSPWVMGQMWWIFKTTKAASCVPLSLPWPKKASLDSWKSYWPSDGRLR